MTSSFSILPITRLLQAQNLTMARKCQRHSTLAHIPLQAKLTPGHPRRVEMGKENNLESVSRQHSACGLGLLGVTYQHYEKRSPVSFGPATCKATCGPWAGRIPEIKPFLGFRIWLLLSQEYSRLHSGGQYGKRCAARITITPREA